MKHMRIAVGALGAAGLLWAQMPPAVAQEDDIATLRAAIEALRHDYDVKIQDLETRLNKAEAEAKAAKAVAATAQAAATTAAAKAQKSAEMAQVAPPPAPVPQAVPRTPVSASAMNPGISVVLNGFYNNSSHDPEAARMPGFALGEEAGLIDRGFSLGESEVVLAANIDPYLLGNLVVAFTNDGEAEVEEAFIQTTSLGNGFTLKGGRFFSGIGYLNERHAHNWTFSDQALPYRAFLANQYGDDGVQVRWLAPTDLFLELGAEWFRGDSFPAEGAAHNGQGTVTAFVHAGGDISDSSSWLAALSYLHGSADQRDTDGDIFNGKDDLGILSLVYKWAPGGNTVQRNLVLSSEIFYGKEQGVFNGVPVDYDRNGFYAQGVYQFMPRWSVGLRYAQLGTDPVPLALAGSTLDDMGNAPRALSALLEYDSSEFGRFRIQYNRDESDLRDNDQILFQYTIIYGPHAAHRY